MALTADTKVRATDGNGRDDAYLYSLSCVVPDSIAVVPTKSGQHCWAGDSSAERPSGSN